MILSLNDYRDRVVDPTAPFIPTAVHDELLEAGALDPAAQLPASLAQQLTRARGTSALRLQQHLVYRIGTQLGVLQSAVQDVRGALSAVVSLTGENLDELVAEAVSTAIGVASDALSWIPIAGWILKVIDLSVSISLAAIRAMETPGTYIGSGLVTAQQYKTDGDTALANDRLLVQAESRDWTSMFMPSMRGQLGAQIRRDGGGRIVIAWGLRDDGIVPRVVIDTRPLLKPYTWHFSETSGNIAGRDNPFTPSNGLGAVPGSGRIVSVVQSFMQEAQNLHRGHESLGDPRCGSDRKTVDVDTGTYYPSTASGAASLFAYCTKASASTYTIATQDVAGAWQAAMDEIWDGIERLWRNESWESGYGCGTWQNALQGLAAAHCVGSDGQPGGFGAWRPTRYQTKLTAADRNAWEANNLYTRLVKPAMMELRDMQLDLLRKTPMAAYLPAHGLGSMSDVSVKEAFDAARAKLLNGFQRSSKLRLEDVVDDYYRRMLEQRGRGTTGGDGGIGAGDYKPPRLAMPSGGGGGRGAIVLLGLGIAAGVGGLVIRARRRR